MKIIVTPCMVCGRNVFTTGTDKTPLHHFCHDLLKKNKQYEKHDGTNDRAAGDPSPAL